LSYENLRRNNGELNVDLQNSTKGKAKATANFSNVRNGFPRKSRQLEMSMEMANHKPGFWHAARYVVGPNSIRPAMLSTP
jgi:hypothetical protein